MMANAIRSRLKNRVLSFARRYDWRAMEWTGHELLGWDDMRHSAGVRGHVYGPMRRKWETLEALLYHKKLPPFLVAQSPRYLDEVLEKKSQGYV